MHLWSLSAARLGFLSILVLATSSLAQVADPPTGLTAYNVILHKQISTHSGANDVWGYTSPGGVELAIWGHNVGTSFVNATDPPNAVEIFNLPGPISTWRDIKTYQNYAYVVTEGGAAGTGLQIVDLTDPLNPVHVSTYTAGGFSTAHNIWIDVPAGVAYACGADGGTHILSLADPENPVEIDFFTPYYIHDLFVGSGLGFAGAISTGTLRIMDVSTPSNPVTIATHGYSGAATHAAWPTADGTHVVTADETLGGHVKVWNMQNLSNIQLTAEVFAGESVIHNVFGVNDLFYCSWYTAGTRILDISDPTDPVEVGFYDTSPFNGGGFKGNWGTYPFRADDVIYSTDRQEGLFILEFTGSFAGEIQGVVRDATSSLPLAGADIALLNTPVDLTSAADGSYSGRVGGNTYDVVITTFGYFSDTTSVIVPPNGSVVHDVQLQQMPIGNVEVTVTGAISGQPVEGALVSVEGTPLVGLLSDALGQVTLVGLPSGSPWTVSVDRFGWVAAQRVVTSSAGVTQTASVGLARGFHDDFDRDQAWIAGLPGDTATGGQWERAVPSGSFFLGIVGPDEDATPTGAGLAYVTQRHTAGFVGTSDVDGGHTTLLTPVFDGTGLGTLTLSYNRWFSNRAPAQSTDEFNADVSTDGGGTWTNLESLSTGTDSWSEVLVNLSAVVAPTTQMQLRFVAEDLGTATYVEAGLDDVLITTGATSTPLTGVTPALMALRNAGPNPFRSTTSFEFELPRSGEAALEVFDISGRRVTTLLEGTRVAAGRHRATWDGRDAVGALVSPGIYFVQLITDTGATTSKVTFIK